MPVCSVLLNGIISEGTSAIGCLNGATTTMFNALQGTSTGLIGDVANTLMTGVFAFVRYILPYALVIGLLMVGLGIVWRVFRGVGKV